MNDQIIYHSINIFAFFKHILTLSFAMLPFNPLENMRKPLVFGGFSEESEGNIAKK